MHLEYALADDCGRAEQSIGGVYTTQPYFYYFATAVNLYTGKTGIFVQIPLFQETWPWETQGQFVAVHLWPVAGFARHPASFADDHP